MSNPEAGPLVSRLLEAIEKREKSAREAQAGPWHVGNAVDPTQPCNIHTFPGARGVADNLGWLDAEHIIWHDPASVLRLCQAHREIVELHQPVEGYHEYWSKPKRLFCVLCSADLTDGMRVGDLYPCRTLTALATAYNLQEET